MEKRKLLVLLISALAILTIAGGIIYKTFFQDKEVLNQDPVVLHTEGSPSIGNPQAKVHIVVFEDLRCSHCAQFSKDIFPKIQKKYIETNQVYYTLIPVAFLPGSKYVANVALEVYATSPPLFFPFIEKIYETNPRNKRALLNLAASIKGINLEKVKACMRAGCHQKQLNENLIQIQEIMGRNYSTPSLYINGVQTRTDFHSVDAKISKLLKEIE